MLPKLSAANISEILYKPLNDGGEVVGAFQTFGVEYVNVLGARRARGKPAAGRDNFQAASLRLRPTSQVQRSTDVRIPLLPIESLTLKPKTAGAADLSSPARRTWV